MIMEVLTNIEVQACVCGGTDAALLPDASS